MCLHLHLLHSEIYVDSDVSGKATNAFVCAEIVGSNPGSYICDGGYRTKYAVVWGSLKRWLMYLNSQDTARITPDGGKWYKFGA